MVLVFDLVDFMGLLICVVCGECVIVCLIGVLMEKSLLDEIVIKWEVYVEEIVDSVCLFCGVGCLILVLVIDGKIVKVDGCDGLVNENCFCVKGWFGFDYVVSFECLIWLLIWCDDVLKGVDVVLMFDSYLDVFWEVIWEEVLDWVVGGFKVVFYVKGGVGIVGFGFVKGFNEEVYFFQKLICQGFGINNVDYCMCLCYVLFVVVFMEGIGFGVVMVLFMVVVDVDCMIVIGVCLEQNYLVVVIYIKQVVKNGIKLIVMDLCGQGLMWYVDYGFKFKFGIDVVMLNVILNVIIIEKFYDE